MLPTYVEILVICMVKRSTVYGNRCFCISLVHMYVKLKALLEVHASQNEDVSYNIDRIKRITRKTYQ